jgi:hypothetical protein
MADWNKVLLEWAENYIRYKDSVQGKIRDLKLEKDRIVIFNKDDSKELALCLPELSKLDLASIKEPTLVVTPNRKENLKFLTDSWKALASRKEITIAFINPNSSLEVKWIIKPYVHDRICDEKSLKIGLKAMFETVDEVM